MLPDGSIAWPPPHLGGLRADMAEASVWYAGDPDDLADFYAATSGGVRTRPSQRAGGVRGRLARWWWGVPTAQGEQPTKLHVPLAADICTTRISAWSAVFVKTPVPPSICITCIGDGPGPMFGVIANR